MDEPPWFNFSTVLLKFIKTREKDNLLPTLSLYKSKNLNSRETVGHFICFVYTPEYTECSFHTCLSVDKLKKSRKIKKKIMVNFAHSLRLLHIFGETKACNLMSYFRQCKRFYTQKILPTSWLVKNLEVWGNTEQGCYRKWQFQKERWI